MILLHRLYRFESREGEVTTAPRLVGEFSTEDEARERAKQDSASVNTASLGPPPTTTPLNRFIIQEINPEDGESYTVGKDGSMRKVS